MNPIFRDRLDKLACALLLFGVLCLFGRLVYYLWVYGEMQIISKVGFTAMGLSILLAGIVVFDKEVEKQKTKD